jgi:hypothetical protein
MAEVHPVEATTEALFDGSCKELLEPKSREKGVFGAAGTPEAAIRLLAGGGARKEDALGSPKDDTVCGVYAVPTLLLPCKSCPCNSFSASMAN